MSVDGAGFRVWASGGRVQVHEDQGLRVKGAWVTASERRGNSLKGLCTFTCKPEPEAGLDCVICGTSLKTCVLLRFWVLGFKGEDSGCTIKGLGLMV